MATKLSDAFTRLRRPEYTGKNRCFPCTAVNLVIAAIAALTLGVLVFLSGSVPEIAASLGVGLFGVSAVVIYLRGYLIPGTPWLTQTYFPDWVLRLFDKQTKSTTTESVNTEEVLLSIGVVEECANRADLCLTPDFRRAWHERMETLRQTNSLADRLAEILEIDPARLEFEDHDTTFLVFIENDRMGQWESKAAFLADIAAEQELRQRCDDWDAFDIQKKDRVVTALRIFLETCPACGGDLAVEEEQGCCRPVDVMIGVCGDCGARVFEMEEPDSY